MNVVLFGATGMVGAGVLAECLDDDRVRSVLVVGRSPCGVRHPKVREVLRPDLFDLSDLAPDLAGKDAWDTRWPRRSSRSSAGWRRATSRPVRTSAAR